MDDCYDLPDLDTGPVGPRHSSWVMALASPPMVGFVLSFFPVPCYATPCLQYQHILPSMLMVQIVLRMCSGNVLNGYVIFI